MCVCVCESIASSGERVKDIRVENACTGVLKGSLRDEGVRRLSVLHVRGYIYI